MGIFKKKTDREKLNKLIEKRKKLKKKKEVKESKNKKTKIVDKKMEKNQSKINISNVASIKTSEMENSMVNAELEEPKIMMTQQKFANTLLPLQMKQEAVLQHEESNFTNDPIP